MWKWARTLKKCTCEIRSFHARSPLLEPLPKQSRHCLSHRVVTRSSDLQQRHDVVAVVSALLLTVAAAHDALLSFKTSCLPFSVTSTTAKRRGKRLASKQRPRSFSNTRTLPDLTKRQGGWSDRPGADGRKPVDVAPGDRVLANRFLVSKSLCIALLAFGFQKDFRDQTYFAVSECRNPILILGLTMRVWSARVRARFQCTARPSSPL